MREIKREMIKIFVNEFNGNEMYDVIGTYGRDIFELFVDSFRVAAPKVKLNKRTVDWNIASLFEEDLKEARYGPVDGRSYRNMHNYAHSITNVMWRLYLHEVERRTRLTLDDSLHMWKEIEKHHDISLRVAARNLTFHYMNDKFGGHSDNSVHRIDQTNNISEYIRSEMFKLTSRHIKTMNNKRFGFSFSDTLMCVSPRLIGKKKGRGSKGRAPKRHCMVHMCPDLPTPDRMMLRPINDMTVPPAFFCKHCKEKLTNAHKTFYRLMMIGRKV